MSGKKKEIEQDFELNIASIIDCFTVLITYLLVSASFISLGILDVTVAAISPEQAKILSQSDEGEAPLALTINLLKSSDIQIVLTGGNGKDAKNETLAPKNNEPDWEGLSTLLKNYKTNLTPSHETAMVTGDDTVPYKNLIRGVEIVKDVFPKVGLGGDI